MGGSISHGKNISIPSLTPEFRLPCPPHYLWGLGQVIAVWGPGSKSVKWGRGWVKFQNRDLSELLQKWYPSLWSLLFSPQILKENGEVGAGGGEAGGKACCPGHQSGPLTAQAGVLGVGRLERKGKNQEELVRLLELLLYLLPYPLPTTVLGTESQASSFELLARKGCHHTIPVGKIIISSRLFLKTFSNMLKTLIQTLCWKYFLNCNYNENCFATLTKPHISWLASPIHIDYLHFYVIPSTFIRPEPVCLFEWALCTRVFMMLLEGIGDSVVLFLTLIHLF